MAFLLYFLRILFVGSYENYKRFMNYVFPSVPMIIFLHLWFRQKLFFLWKSPQKKMNVLGPIWNIAVFAVEATGQKLAL